MKLLAMVIAAFGCVLACPHMGFAAEMPTLSPQGGLISLGIALLAAAYGLISRQLRKDDAFLVVGAGLILLLWSSGNLALLLWLGGFIAALVVLWKLWPRLSRRRHRQAAQVPLDGLEEVVRRLRALERDPAFRQQHQANKPIPPNYHR